jgi:hypothetical protein
MRRKNILARLEGGDRRSIGRADEVAAEVARNPRLFPELISGLWSADALVRMRAADAAEKVTRENSKLLQPYKRQLLGLMADATEQELRWHLAAIAPRLWLDAAERKLASLLLRGYLDDRSSIVRTFALQGLAELAERDLSLRGGVIALLRGAVRDGTPAMRARGRKLLARLGRL